MEDVLQVYFVLFEINGYLIYYYHFSYIYMYYVYPIMPWLKIHRWKPSE